MNKFSIDISPIQDDMTAGALLLTPNHRTALQLLEAWGNYQLEQHNCKVVVTPAVYPVDIWLRDIWDELMATGVIPVSEGRLLHPTQEFLLWKRIISNSSRGSSLLNLEATSKQVQEAYRLLQLWQISREELLQHYGEYSDKQFYDDLGLFLEWEQSFREQMETGQYLTLASLVEKCTHYLESGNFTLPGKLLLCEFSNPPPLYSKLLDSISGMCKCEQFQPTYSDNSETRFHAVSNETAEVVEAAQWAYALLKTDPQARIGIVCPNLHARHEEFRRVFTQQFNGGRELSMQRNLHPDFHINHGAALAELPLIAAALSLLRLNSPHIATLDLCQLLRSPFLLKASEESNPRTELEFRLRRLRESRCSMNRLRFMTQQEDRAWFCPALGSALESCKELAAQNQGKRDARQWLEIIDRQLTLFGWPGELPPDASERLQLTHWEELLSQFAEHSNLYGPLYFNSAMELLQQMAKAISFAPGNFQAPIQILSPLEAEGLYFSHGWFMGLSEQQWPPAPNPNPFLPVRIQQRHRIPDAIPELHLEAGRKILAAFTRQCQHTTVFSFPQMSEELQMTPTPLLKNISPPEPLCSGADQLLHPLVTSSLSENATELFTDNDYLALGQDEETGGGTALIADQAACPFRSFALHRLHARELPTLYYGLPPEAIGKLLHTILENLWLQLNNQQSLMKLSASGKLNHKVERIVTDALEDLAKYHPETMTPAFIRLESERINDLVLDWMEEEQKRGAFEILKLEHDIQWQHANLTLNFRIDRIDRDSHGQTILVDYKSSINNRVNWLDERQDNPQLLLYMAAAQQADYPDINALLFAQVNIEDMRYRGIAADDDIYPGTGLSQQRNLSGETDWASLQKTWIHALQTLADQFLAGYLVIDPKGQQSCQYCHLQSLCRISEQGQLS